MTTKRLLAGLLACLVLSFAVSADDKTRDYSELSKLLQKEVAEKCPKRFEDKSHWGRTVSAMTPVRMPRLPRTIVKVNGRDEFPDGSWKRSVFWLDDPAKQIQVRVVDVKHFDGNKHVVTVDAGVFVHCEREQQEWKNGFKLLGVTVKADARVNVQITCDIKITFDASKFPPDVLAEPKVAAIKIDLKEFDLHQIGRVMLEGDLPRLLGNELKELLQQLIKAKENEIKDFANASIAQALKGGPARVSPADLLKLKSAGADAKK